MSQLIVLKIQKLKAHACNNNNNNNNKQQQQQQQQQKQQQKQKNNLSIKNFFVNVSIPMINLQF